MPTPPSLPSPDAQLDAVGARLTALRDRGFYGTVKIVYEAGIIQKLTQEESIKLPKTRSLGLRSIKPKTT